MITIHPRSRLAGKVKVPGDKSISHRAIMLGSLASGTTEIRGFLKGADCLSTIDCFRKMGILIEEKEETIRALYTEKGELAVSISKFPFVVGKRKEDVDYVLADYSTSRVHARFVEEKDGIYLEDLNSTNGTFKNGLRMQPYEKRKVEPEDTIRFGKSVYVYK